MNRTCEKCGARYPLKTFTVDSGFCPQCRPPFLSTSTLRSAAHVWQLLLGVHVVYLILFSMFLDDGYVGDPGGLYSLIVILYSAARLALGSRRGFPMMTERQGTILMFLPAYGPVGFVFLFHLAQSIRYGT